MPRASVNGEPMPQVYREWAERNYAELFREIDATLSAPPGVARAP
jgi:hypothetical protein